jgi:NAD(P)-dependent dehydrogenase (short-subunit alcohol dehydrogenase family)
LRGLRGKTALVTGATGLIGGEIARRLASEGANVIVASRSLGKAENWIADLKAKDATSFVPCEINLLDASSIKRGFDELESARRMPTIFIAAASLREGLATTEAELEHDNFTRLFGSDIAGHYFCAREIVERMKGVENEVSMLWLSSIYAQVGVDHRIYPEGMMPTPVQYAAVKSAVSGLVAYLAAEWGRLGVRVNALVSGGVGAQARQPGDFAERYAQKTMLGRMGTAGEIASAALFLVSSEASYITGTCLVVDGGFTRW